MLVLIAFGSRGMTQSDLAAALGTAGLEKSQRLLAIAHQQVLGLLIVVKHHLVIFASYARLLAAAERGVCRIHVIAVCPHTLLLCERKLNVEKLHVCVVHAALLQ